MTSVNEKHDQKDGLNGFAGNVFNNTSPIINSQYYVADPIENIQR